MSKTIVCFGDSNTHGYNSKNNGRFTEKERYTCLLDELLGEEYLVREEGLGGRTTVFEDPLYEGMSGLSAIFYVLMTHEPIDLLVIMLGTNDTKERFHCNAENIAKGMERLVTKAIHTPKAFRDLKPNILVISPLPIEDGYDEIAEVSGEMGKGCAEKSRELAHFYEAMAQKMGVHFLDAASIPGMKMYPYDKMHFSPESHRLLAEKLAEIIPALCP